MLNKTCYKAPSALSELLDVLLVRRRRSFARLVPSNTFKKYLIIIYFIANGGLFKMAFVNENYCNLKESYLFADIAHQVSAYAVAHPDKKIIRLGIGDVTRPLAPCVVEAMTKAVAEMGVQETFRGYGPEQGYDFLRERIRAEKHERSRDKADHREEQQRLSEYSFRTCIVAQRDPLRNEL